MLNYSYDPGWRCLQIPKEESVFKRGEEINGFHNYFCDLEI